MAIYEVFSHPLFIRYRTSLCSKTTSIYVVLTTFTVICPFLITYYTQGFWRKIDFYREQPDISFKHQMLLILETKFVHQLIFWSTYEELNSIMRPDFQQILPSVEHREDDNDRDGNYDELQMAIDIPLSKEEIMSLKLILIFDFKLYLHSLFHMESAAFVHCSSSLPGASLTYIGELSLMQREPLRHTGVDERYNMPVVDVSNTNQLPNTLENILLNYMKRNVTTTLSNVYHVWETGRGFNESFKINLVILYPEQTILYKVGFWQLLKWAFVQYITIFLVLSCIVQKIKLYLFQKQILPSIVIHPLKKTL